jgi:hypothetical protein
MRRLIVALALIGLPGVAHAEFKKVTRQESKVLLEAPLLQNGREIYEYGGWNASGGQETSYAAIVPAKGAYPRMQVYVETLASLHHWKFGNALDEKWLKGAFPFLKDKPIQITAQAPQQGAYLRVVRFTVGGTNCAGFEMRAVDAVGGVNSDESRNSISGFYCAPVGTVLTDDLVKQATEGVYVRGDSGVQRAVKGVSRPVPATLL